MVEEAENGQMLLAYVRTGRRVGYADRHAPCGYSRRYDLVLH